MVWAAVEDLIFLSKIQEAARQLKIPLRVVAPARLQHELAADRPVAVLLDLNHPAAMTALRALKDAPDERQIRIVGFLSHVETDLARSARAAGCDAVLARSGFSRRLPQILRDLASAA